MYYPCLLLQRTHHLHRKTMSIDVCLRPTLFQTEFIGVAKGQQLSLANHADLVGQLLCVVHVMRIQEDRHAFVLHEPRHVIREPPSAAAVWRRGAKHFFPPDPPERAHSPPARCQMNVRAVQCELSLYSYNPSVLSFLRAMVVAQEHPLFSTC